MTYAELEDFEAKLEALRARGTDAEYVREIDPLIDALVKALRHASKCLYEAYGVGTALEHRVADLEEERDKARADVTHWRVQWATMAELANQNLREKQHAEADRAMLLSVLEGVAKHTGVSVESICEDPSVVARERDEAREQKLAAEQRFDTMEAEYLKAWRESMEAQDSLRLMRAAATNFEKALTAEVAAHAETRTEIDELAIAVGYGERPEGQSGVHRLSGEQLADRWKQLNRELDEAQAEVKRLREAAWKIRALAGAVCRWPDVSDAVAVAQKIHEIAKGIVE